MKAVNLVFPHQLFKDNILLKNKHPFYIIEAWLFFKQYNFHKQKIAFHRASMQFYKDYLIQQKKEVIYIDAQQKTAKMLHCIPYLKSKGVQQIHYIDTTDNWLEKRIKTACDKANLSYQKYNNTLFLNTTKDLQSFFKPEKKKFFQTKFYIEQRKKRNILVDEALKPEGGKWSFDAENRKKYPKKKMPPIVQFPASCAYYKEAFLYTQKHFKQNIGEINEQPFYPINFKTAELWLQQFLEIRFYEFGIYEDAIVKEASILNHSVLTPMLNVGLLTPQQIIDKTLNYAEQNDIPNNSTEGFIRQIIGWREFIRGVYECKGSQQRTTNFWGFQRPVPTSFYNATTGIYPIDKTIKKILKSGYCHHIERLMILGNFMVLCEFNPNAVYQWFMELFIDAYDWVMVPNVYGMSQFADGGLMSTKPYISGSNYILKMSNYGKGDWQAIWDALFWRFMHTNRNFFIKNPRLSMLVRNFDKMDIGKQQLLISTAENYLKNL